MTGSCSFAIVTSGYDLAEALLKSLRRAKLLPSDAEPTFFDVHYTPAPQDGSPPRRHLFWDKSEESFDIVVCSSAVRFFESTWGASFIFLLMRKCKPGGLIVIPAWQGSQNNPTLYFSAGRLERLLGTGDTERVPNYVCFRRPERIGGDVSSMLLWSTTHIGDDEVYRYVTSDDAANLPAVKRLAEAGSQVRMDPTFEADLRRASELGARSDVFGDPASEFLRTLNYWAGGLAYKAPAVTDAARLCGLQPGATLVDYGGGAGFLAVECVLEPDCPIKRATVVDLSPGNALVFDRISRDLRPALRDRVQFVAGSIERWLPDEPVDMITCVGALLYLPRAEVSETLSAWWSKLKPGGVLFIHENIRQPNTPPSRDRLRMFDEPEIAAALGAFGTPRFIATTTRRELSAADAAGKSMFRFIQKAR